MASGAALDFASSYVAGEAIDDAVAVTRRLQGQGLLVSLAYLPSSDDEAETTDMLCRALDALGEGAEGVEISVKPSSLGLRDSPASARARLEDLCRVTTAAGAVVTLEMQGTEGYDETLAAVGRRPRRLRPDRADPPRGHPARRTRRGADRGRRGTGQALRRVLSGAEGRGLPR